MQKCMYVKGGSDVGEKGGIRKFVVLAVKNNYN